MGPLRPIIAAFLNVAGLDTSQPPPLAGAAQQALATSHKHTVADASEADALAAVKAERDKPQDRLADIHLLGLLRGFGMTPGWMAAETGGAAAYDHFFNARQAAQPQSQPQPAPTTGPVTEPNAGGG